MTLEVDPSAKVCVEEATMECTGGDIDKIRERASALVTTTEAEMAKLDQGENQSDTGTALGLLGQAVLTGTIPGSGIKEMLSFGEFLSARAEDKALMHGASDAASSPASAPSRTMDESIASSTKRSPGLYRETAHAATYGGNPKGAKDLSANLVERVSLAASSLRKPDSAGLITPRAQEGEGGNAKIDPKKTINTQYAKSLISQTSLANKRAYESTIKMAAQRNATIGMAHSMAPGLGNIAPRPTSRILADARQQSEDEGRARV